jgi:integrase
VDINDFWEFLVTEHNPPLEAITADIRVRRFRNAIKNGLDMPAIDSDDRDRLQRALRGWLGKVRRERSRHAYNHHVEMVNSLAQFKGLPDLKWKRVRARDPQPHGYSERELAALRAYRTRNERELKLRRAVLWINLSLGIRTGEISRMNVSDLDERDLAVAIKTPSKLGEARLLPVRQELFAKTRPLAAWLRIREAPKDDPDALFVSIADGPSRRLAPEGIGRVLWNIGQDVGFAVNAQRGRHTVAMRMVDDNVHIKYVQDWLGHKSLNSTQKYLRGTTPEKMREAVYGRRYARAHQRQAESAAPS